MPPRKNYTEREKRDLLEVVNKYKSILENKSTNAVSIERKKRTWEKVALEFNAGSELPRSAKQLQTAYQNLKRITRQNVADENVKKYILQSEDVKKFKKDNAHDKKEIRTTGGGTFTPALSEVGAQVLALMGDHQIKPLSNECDSASSYYMCDIEVEYEDQSATPLEQPAPPVDQPASPVDQPASPVDQPASPVNQPASPVNQPAPQVSQPKLPRSSRKQQKKKFKEETTEQIKKKFYKKKLECAVVEKHNKLANYKLTQKKLKIADIELKIKELQYSSLLSNK